MIEKIVEWVVGFGKFQIGFWLLIYEVIIYMVKGKLLPFLRFGLEKRIQIQHDLEFKATHNKGEEPKIKIYQRCANISDFHVEIIRLEAVCRSYTEEIIEQFSYNASNVLFKDKHKLFFPKDIPPLNLANTIEYWIIGADKFAIADPNYRNHAFPMTVEYAIDFRTRSTTITKTDKKIINIRPEDWKGGE